VALAASPRCWSGRSRTSGMCRARLIERGERVVRVCTAMVSGAAPVSTHARSASRAWSDRHGRSADRRRHCGLHAADRRSLRWWHASGDGYEIVRVVGRGGMATVYLTRQLTSSGTSRWRSSRHWSTSAPRGASCARRGSRGRSLRTGGCAV